MILPATFLLIVKKLLNLQPFIVKLHALGASTTEFDRQIGREFFESFGNSDILDAALDVCCDIVRHGVTVDVECSVSGTVTDGSKTATCTITVKNPPVKVSSVTLSEHSFTMESGTTHTLTATVLPANADDPTVEWSSSNENVATVSQSGVVTAKSVSGQAVALMRRLFSLISSFLLLSVAISCDTEIQIYPDEPNPGIVLNASFVGGNSTKTEFGRMTSTHSYAEVLWSYRDSLSL